MAKKVKAAAKKRVGAKVQGGSTSTTRAPRPPAPAPRRTRSRADTAKIPTPAAWIATAPGLVEGDVMRLGRLGAARRNVQLAAAQGFHFTEAAMLAAIRAAFPTARRRQRVIGRLQAATVLDRLARKKKK